MLSRASAARGVLFLARLDPIEHGRTSNLVRCQAQGADMTKWDEEFDLISIGSGGAGRTLVFDGGLVSFLEVRLNV
jgi:hypothetical protein